MVVRVLVIPSARTGFSDMDIATGYKTITVMSLLMGVTALISIALAGPMLGV
jgi:H+/gluconate symporter-like permease